MAKNPAPATLTGGAGFEFENQVAAWFMIHMLGKRLPLDQEFGLCQSIDFQVKDSGWLLDDLLITGQAGSEPPKRLSISIKRDRQVTGKGFPPTFVKATWQEWLGTESSNFVHDQDLLGLVVGVLAGGVQQKWEDMLSVVLETPADRVVSRFSSPGYSNEEQRNIFRSFDYPISLGAAPENGDIVKAKLLKHIRLLYFDFRSPDSQKRAEAIQLCQDCLRSGDSAEASILWDAMVGIAGNLRSKGGSIDLNQLLQKLRMFSFREFPDYRSDWDTLAHVSQDALNHVKTVIGDNIEVPRVELLEQITAGLREFNLQIIIGESGTGKSALAKSIEESGHFDRTVWLSSDLFARGGIHAVSATLGLQHGLMDVLKSFGGDNGLLIIDALEKADLTTLQVITDLIRNLDLDSDTSRWSVLITTQARGWTSAEHLFQKTAINLTSEMLRVISFPSFKELLPLRNALPGLQILFQRRELQELLSNLKILDWIAIAASQSDKGLSSLVGMSEIIDWIWKSWIQTGSTRHARAGLLMHLGEQEAVSFSGGTSIADLDIGQQEMLAFLEDDNILVVKEERVRFAHDLIGDWARLHILIGYAAPEVPEKVKGYATQPIWHHAIRLYGIRILEESNDGNEWHRVHKEIDGSTSGGMIAKDLILESIALAPNASILLEMAWLHLASDNGQLLSRLLNRFRHTASIPDPRNKHLSADMELTFWLSLSMRIPYWPYWGPMLLFLHNHMDDVKLISMRETAEVCRLWLSVMPKEIATGTPFPWRSEAAKLALAIAREVQAQIAEGLYFHDGNAELAYETMLYGAYDLPEEVSQLCLELARRRPLNDEIQTRVDENKKKLAEEREAQDDDPDLPSAPISLGSAFYGPIPDPWPDGPSERIDDAFRKACMRQVVLKYLIEVRPEVARELVLALCIERPKPKDLYGSSLGLMNHGTVGDTHKAMFFKGPFLLFLRTNPETAIDLLTTLVDFATARWKEWAVEPGGIGHGRDVNEDLSVNLWYENRKIKLFGDMRVYGWHRDRLISGKYIVSALMALEKWLYDEADEDRDITKWVKLLLKSGHSTAFAAVLISVGRKHLELFKSSLKPLLSVWQIYSWDYKIQSDDATDFGLILWGRYGEAVYNLVRDWHQMPHRKVILQEEAVRLMVTEDTIKSQYKKLLKKWRGQRYRCSDLDQLNHVIARFDLKNYQLYKDEEGNYGLGFEWPDDLKQESDAVAQRSAFMLQMLSFPIRCRKQINKREGLNSEELDEFWQTLQGFVDGLDGEYEYQGYQRNAIMGGIAVLGIFHFDWLVASKEREEWWIQQFQQIISSPPVSDSMDIPESISDIESLLSG